MLNRTQNLVMLVGLLAWAGSFVSTSADSQALGTPVHWMERAEADLRVMEPKQFHDTYIEEEDGPEAAVADRKASYGGAMVSAFGDLAMWHAVLGEEDPKHKAKAEALAQECVAMIPEVAKVQGWEYLWGMTPMLTAIEAGPDAATKAAEAIQHPDARAFGFAMLAEYATLRGDLEALQAWQTKAIQANRLNQSFQLGVNLAEGWEDAYTGYWQWLAGMGGRLGEPLMGFEALTQDIKSLDEQVEVQCAYILLLCHAGRIEEAHRLWDGIEPSVQHALQEMLEDGWSEKLDLVYVAADLAKARAGLTTLEQPDWIDPQAERLIRENIDMNGLRARLDLGLLLHLPEDVRKADPDFADPASVLDRVTRLALTPDLDDEALWYLGYDAAWLASDIASSDWGDRPFVGKDGPPGLQAWYERQTHPFLRSSIALGIAEGLLARQGLVK